MQDAITSQTLLILRVTLLGRWASLSSFKREELWPRKIGQLHKVIQVKLVNSRLA